MVAAILTSLLCSGMAHAQKAVFEEGDGSRKGAAVTYDYVSDSLFQVNTKVGNVTDIQFRDGETIGYIAGGDTKRWMIDKAVVAGVPHVYIKPIAKDISTNIIVNTNLRSYRLNVSSTDCYDPLIIFSVPGEKAMASEVVEKIPERSARNYRYKFEAKKKADASLMPEEIFDDGLKTYIRISEKNKYDMPVLYTVDPWDKKLSLVNYRVKDNWMVADKVMEKGRLLYHQKFYIDFENLQKTKMGKKTVYQTPPERGRILDMLDETREDTIYDAMEVEEARYQNEENSKAEEKVHKEEMKAYEREIKARKDEERRLAKEEARVKKEAEKEAQRRVAAVRKQREAEQKALKEKEAREAREAKAAQEKVAREKAEKVKQAEQNQEKDEISELIRWFDAMDKEVG